MDIPSVISLGHAGLRIDARDLTLLCDPWLSPGGAFLGSWFQFPDNSNVRERAAEGVQWVAISHEHLDHFDADFLAGLPDSVRIVIPRYPSPAFRNRLAATGVKHIIELDAWARLPLNTRGDWLTVIPEQSPMCHDAAILISVGGVSVLHANDARLSVAQVRRAMAETGGPIDLMGVQMSGASWHPICYEYPQEVIAKISADKRSGKFKAVTRLVRAVKPRIVMPYAGPPCFLDPELARHNAQIPEPGIFPDQEQAADWLRARLPGQDVLVMLPGDAVGLVPRDADGGPPAVDVRRDPRWAGFSLADPEAVAVHVKEYAAARAREIEAVWAAHPDPEAGSGLAERFAAHFLALGAMSDYFNARIDMTIRFVVEGADGGVWDVHLRPDGVAVDTAGSAADVQYRLTMQARWLAAVLSGEIRWEDLFLSLRFSAWRSPDVYNDYLVGLLKHADPTALAAVEEYETGRSVEDTTVVQTPDGPVVVGRYCPHAGEDLAEGAVVEQGPEGPLLRCLAHHFAFDLATGACVNARCDPLAVGAAR